MGKVLAFALGVLAGLGAAAVVAERWGASWYPPPGETRLSFKAKLGQIVGFLDAMDELAATMDPRYVPEENRGVQTDIERWARSLA